MDKCGEGKTNIDKHIHLQFMHYALVFWFKFHLKYIKENSLKIKEEEK